MSQEFSRTESRILGALLKLDEFLLSSQNRVQSGTAPETFRNYDREIQEYNEDRSRNDSHAELGTSSQSVNLDSDPVHQQFQKEV